MRKDRDVHGNVVLRPPTEAERNRGFDLYAALKQRLVAQGVPARQIAFIHDLDAVSEKNRDAARRSLFRKVREGDIRILVGSTGKMGTGMNVQDHLVALHNMDPAWKPSDIEQRNGRILRPGNQFAAADPEFGVRILNYITQGRGQQFGIDAYMWQLNEAKADIIARFFAGNLTDRNLELDLEQTVTTASQFKAAATGNPLVITYNQVHAEVQRLEQVRAGWEEAQREAEYNWRAYSELQKQGEERAAKYARTADVITPQAVADESTAEIEKQSIAGHTAIGNAILAIAKRDTRATDATPGEWKSYTKPITLGSYRGLRLTIEGNGTDHPWVVLRHPEAEVPRYGAGGDERHASARVDLLKPDPSGPGGLAWAHTTGLVTRINNALDKIREAGVANDFYAGRAAVFPSTSFSKDSSLG